MSPEAQSVYQVLLASPHSLSARQIGTKMGIIPNTVYRLTVELLNLGLITIIGKYPYLFAAKPTSDGLSLFLLNQQNWFMETFTHHKPIPKSRDISISFVQSRDELMRLSVDETNQATKSIDLLRSGREIPADLILAIRKSYERHVVTRMLIQDYGPENKNMVSYWKKNGILVRKTELRHIRLMIYDTHVVYFMSYIHTDSAKDMGMKINYPPFSSILTPLFNEWWNKAEVV